MGRCAVGIARSAADATEQVQTADEEDVGIGGMDHRRGQIPAVAGLKVARVGVDPGISAVVGAVDAAGRGVAT